MFHVGLCSVSFLCVQGVVFCGRLLLLLLLLLLVFEVNRIYGVCSTCIGSLVYQCGSFCEWTLLSALVMCSKLSRCYVLFVLSLRWAEW